VEFQEGEKIANVLAVKDFGRDEHFLMFATRKGTVKKTALSAYANIRSNGIIAINLDEGDELVGVGVTSGHDHIILGTRSGLAIRFEEADVRAMGRSAAGVTGARFKRPGDEVVSMIIVPNGENGDYQLLTACLHGYGKRTPLSEYPCKGRGTRGVINIDANGRNGEVVGMALVNEDDQLMMITQKGIVIRTNIAEIRVTGRNAAGVRLIRLDDNDVLVACAKVDVEEKSDETDAPADDDNGASASGSTGDDATNGTAEATGDDAPPATPDAE
jgi:DNA gyrase subunit A